jgi:hypothetical protein
MLSLKIKQKELYMRRKNIGGQNPKDRAVNSKTLK